MKSRAYIVFGTIFSLGIAGVFITKLYRFKTAEINPRGCQSTLQSQLLLPTAQAPKLSFPNLITSIIEPKYRYLERLTALQKLPKELGDSDIKGIYGFLRQPVRPRDLNEDQYSYLKNCLLNKLRNQSIPPEGLTTLMTSIYTNPKQLEVMRDYAIQHLVLWAERGHDRKDIIDVMWRATSEKGVSVGGTALLGLLHLTASGSDVDVERLKNIALQTAQDSSASDLSRVSAIQVCAQLKAPEVLISARQIIDSKADVSLQMSALAAVGILGSKKDEVWIQSWQEPSDLRIQMATRGALTRLTKRWGVNE